MKKVILTLGFIIIFAMPVMAKSFESFTTEQILQCENYETEEIAVTSTNTTFSFTRTTKAVYVENTGSTHEAYIDLNDGTAVADADLALVLEPGANRSVSGFKTKTIGLIASAGESTTVRVEACF